MSKQRQEEIITEINKLIDDLPDLPEKKGLWSGKLLSVVGYIELTQRGIFKSTVGDKSNHQVVDKQNIGGKLRAELRGIKVLTKIRDTLLQDMRDIYHTMGEKLQGQLVFAERCKKNEYLCGNCVVCFSLGSLKVGKFARRSRWFFPDLFSVEEVEQCVPGYSDFDEAGVLNTVESPSRDGMRSRSSASFATYEYVKPGTRFPFKFMVRDPSKYDLFAFIKAISEVGQVDGIGAYSSRNGRFKVVITGISDGAPLNTASNADLASDFSMIYHPEKLFEPGATVISVQDEENSSLIATAYETYDRVISESDWEKFVNTNVPKGEDEE